MFVFDKDIITTNKAESNKNLKNQIVNKKFSESKFSIYFLDFNLF